ncbi:Casein kinase II subunit beta [Aphelenchoides besseyi]|nr:Casein kinase II subunit beta [Aphelenchoides besseyi]
MSNRQPNFQIPFSFVSAQTLLQKVVKSWTEARNLIFDIESNDESTGEWSDDQRYDSSAELLYTLAHARFINTVEGIELMAEKFENLEFGTCPRAYCESKPVLPIGLSGTGFPHMFFFMRPDLRPQSTNTPYVPPAFGKELSSLNDQAV